MGRDKAHAKEWRKQWLKTPKGKAYVQKMYAVRQKVLKELRKNPEYRDKRRAMIRKWIKTKRGREIQAYWKQKWTETPNGRAYVAAQARQGLDLKPKYLRRFFKGVKDIPPELLTVKALQLKIKRALKEKHST